MLFLIKSSSSKFPNICIRCFIVLNGKMKLSRTEKSNTLQISLFWLWFSHKSLLTGDPRFHSFSLFDPQNEVWVELNWSMTHLLKMFMFLCRILWLSTFFGWSSISFYFWEIFFKSQVGIEHWKKLNFDFAGGGSIKSLAKLLLFEVLVLSPPLDETNESPLLVEVVVSMLIFFLSFSVLWC